MTARRPPPRSLIADPRVRAVNFTGSTGTGQVIGTLAAQNLKPAVLELGGKNSVIVLEDAGQCAVGSSPAGVPLREGSRCPGTMTIASADGTRRLRHGHTMHPAREAATPPAASRA